MRSPRGRASLDRIDRRAMAVLAVGHGCVDICQGAVPALLPFLVLERDLSIAAAGALLLASTIASTTIQPLFGAYSDRLSAPWLLPAGVALGFGGLALAGVASTYPLTFAAILVSGIGVAAYHPEGSRFANYVSASRRATSMSYFALGGNIGFALGPLLMTPLALLLGPPGALAFAVPAVAIPAIVWTQLPHLETFRPAASPEPGAASPPVNGWLAFGQLVAAISCRSFAYFSLLALLPLYFIRVLDSSEALANGALTLMLASGAVGTLVGGRLADRVGRRPVLVASLAGQVPLILVLPALGTAGAIVAAAAIGFVTISSFSVSVVMGQEFLPTRIGLASGFTLGAAIGTGGIAAPLFGAIADAHGLVAAIELSALLPALGALLAVTLPVPEESRRSLARAHAARAASR